MRLAISSLEKYLTFTRLGGEHPMFLRGHVLSILGHMSPVPWLVGPGPCLKFCLLSVESVSETGVVS